MLLAKHVVRLKRFFKRKHVYFSYNAKVVGQEDRWPTLKVDFKPSPDVVRQCVLVLIESLYFHLVLMIIGFFVHSDFYYNNQFYLHSQKMMMNYISIKN